jgi:hypothetical protein
MQKSRADAELEKNRQKKVTLPIAFHQICLTPLQARMVIKMVIKRATAVPRVMDSWTTSQMTLIKQNSKRKMRSGF